MIRSKLLPAVAAAFLAASAALADDDTSTTSMGAAPSGAEPSGAALFAARCAVCHGQDAAGIPGAFPSLHEQIVAFGKLREGRDYLVMVVTTGLMGELSVDGVKYHGVMPAQSGLSEAEVAAVLSFLASDRGKGGANPALTTADVGAARARHPDRSAQATRALRPDFPPP